MQKRSKDLQAYFLLQINHAFPGNGFSLHQTLFQQAQQSCIYLPETNPRKSWHCFQRLFVEEKTQKSLFSSQKKQPFNGSLSFWRYSKKTICPKKTRVNSPTVKNRSDFFTKMKRRSPMARGLRPRWSPQFLFQAQRWTNPWDLCGVKMVGIFWTWNLGELFRLFVCFFGGI